MTWPERIKRAKERGWFSVVDKRKALVLEDIAQYFEVDVDSDDFDLALRTFKRLKAVMGEKR